jgi:hypothetical protein
MELGTSCLIGKLLEELIKYEGSMIYAELQNLSQRTVERISEQNEFSES